MGDASACCSDGERIGAGCGASGYRYIEVRCAGTRRCDRGWSKADGDSRRRAAGGKADRRAEAAGDGCGDDCVSALAPQQIARRWRYRYGEGASRGCRYGERYGSGMGDASAGAGNRDRVGAGYGS